jgi:hypothetical protein
MGLWCGISIDHIWKNQITQCELMKPLLGKHISNLKELLGTLGMFTKTSGRHVAKQLGLDRKCVNKNLNDVF